MEGPLFNSVKKLYDEELYSSVIPVASLLTTLIGNSPQDRGILTAEVEYQTILFHANAYYYERNFRAASKLFDSALLMRKTLVRYKISQMTLIESSYPHFTEIETRYRLAVCYCEMGDQLTALSTLHTVPGKIRPPKVNMLLAKLLHSGCTNNTVEAIVAYKDVLRECPMALDAIDSVLKLGADGTEVTALVTSVSNIPKNSEWWLSSWIKAHAQLYGRKQLEASKTFQTINDSTKFHQNEHLLTHIGKCLYYYGNFTQAQHFLETATMINPHNEEARMPLAVVYEYNHKIPELDKMASNMSNFDENCSAHWFILAESFYAHNKLEKSSSFAHKAITVDKNNVEALLLRGKICLQLKRYKDAICFFRSAQYIANYRFEVYKGLFHSYVGLKRIKEAQTMCALAVRYFRNSPRSYVMFARTLFHSTNQLAKKSARKFVSKALEIDDHYAPAVALMAEICQAEGETQEAISVLRKQVTHYPHHKLFTMLGDIVSAEKDLNGALEYYTTALSMEPTYHPALEGVNALGQTSNSSTKHEQDTSMSASTNIQDDEWPIECDEPSIDAIEMSSPALANDDVESDTFSDPFWQDADAEIN